MKVSLIVAVYKDIEALDVIVRALKDQTYKNFELIVAEDNDAEEMKAYIASIEGIEVKHTFQKDNGIQKARSLNNAILKSSGDYLIFIDGDCVPQSNFIKSHIYLAEEKKVLSGRRVNLGAKQSTDLRKKILSPIKLEKKFFLFYFDMLKDKASHIEQGIYLNPTGLFFKFLQKRKSNLSLLGCNFSCFKKDIFEINGFDESYGQTAVADDTDIQWRFEALGLEMKSCKFAASVFHLYHTRAEERYLNVVCPELELMYERKKTKSYRAVEGLDSSFH